MPDPHADPPGAGPPHEPVAPGPPPETILWPPWAATHLPAAPPPALDRHGLPRETLWQKTNRISRSMSKVLFLGSLITAGFGFVCVVLGTLAESYGLILDWVYGVGCITFMVSAALFVLSVVFLVL